MPLGATSRLPAAYDPGENDRPGIAMQAEGVLERPVKCGGFLSIGDYN
jgi:hypothetical protein